MSISSLLNKVKVEIFVFLPNLTPKNDARFLSSKSNIRRWLKIFNSTSKSQDKVLYPSYVVNNSFVARAGIRNQHSSETIKQSFWKFAFGKPLYQVRNYRIGSRSNVSPLYTTKHNCCPKKKLNTTSNELEDTIKERGISEKRLKAEMRKIAHKIRKDQWIKKLSMFESAENEDVRKDFYSFPSQTSRCMGQYHRPNNSSIVFESKSLRELKKQINEKLKSAANDKALEVIQPLTVVHSVTKKDVTNNNIATLNEKNKDQVKSSLPSPYFFIQENVNKKNLLKKTFIRSSMPTAPKVNTEEETKVEKQSQIKAEVKYSPCPRLMDSNLTNNLSTDVSTVQGNMDFLAAKTIPRTHNIVVASKMEQVDVQQENPCATHQQKQIDYPSPKLTNSEILNSKQIFNASNQIRPCSHCHAVTGDVPKNDVTNEPLLNNKERKSSKTRLDVYDISKGYDESLRQSGKEMRRLCRMKHLNDRNDHDLKSTSTSNRDFKSTNNYASLDAIVSDLSIANKNKGLTTELQKSNLSSWSTVRHHSGELKLKKKCVVQTRSPSTCTEKFPKDFLEKPISQPCITVSNKNSNKNESNPKDSLEVKSIADEESSIHPKNVNIDEQKLKNIHALHTEGTIEEHSSVFLNEETAQDLVNKNENSFNISSAEHVDTVNDSTSGNSETLDLKNVEANNLNISTSLSFQKLSNHSKKGNCSTSSEEKNDKDILFTQLFFDSTDKKKNKIKEAPKEFLCSQSKSQLQSKLYHEEKCAFKPREDEMKSISNEPHLSCVGRSFSKALQSQSSITLTGEKSVFQLDRDSKKHFKALKNLIKEELVSRKKEIDTVCDTLEKNWSVINNSSVFSEQTVTKEGGNPDLTTENKISLDKDVDEKIEMNDVIESQPVLSSTSNVKDMAKESKKNEVNTEISEGTDSVLSNSVVQNHREQPLVNKETSSFQEPTNKTDLSTGLNDTLSNSEEIKSHSISQSAFVPVKGRVCSDGLELMVENSSNEIPLMSEKETMPTGNNELDRIELNQKDEKTDDSFIKPTSPFLLSMKVRPWTEDKSNNTAEANPESILITEEHYSEKVTKSLTEGVNFEESAVFKSSVTNDLSKSIKNKELSSDSFNSAQVEKQNSKSSYISPMKIQEKCLNQFLNKVNKSSLGSSLLNFTNEGPSQDVQPNNDEYLLNNNKKTNIFKAEKVGLHQDHNFGKKPDQTKEENSLNLELQTINTPEKLLGHLKDFIKKEMMLHDSKRLENNNQISSNPLDKEHSHCRPNGFKPKEEEYWSQKFSQIDTLDHESLRNTYYHLEKAKTLIEHFLNKVESRGKIKYKPACDHHDNTFIKTKSIEGNLLTKEIDSDQTGSKNDSQSTSNVDSEKLKKNTELKRNDLANLSLNKNIVDNYPKFGTYQNSMLINSNSLFLTNDEPQTAGPPTIDESNPKESSNQEPTKVLSQKSETPTTVNGTFMSPKNMIKPLVDYFVQTNKRVNNADTVNNMNNGYEKKSLSDMQKNSIISTNLTSSSNKSVLTSNENVFSKKHELTKSLDFVNNQFLLTPTTDGKIDSIPFEILTPSKINDSVTPDIFMNTHSRPTKPPPKSRTDSSLNTRAKIEETRHDFFNHQHLFTPTVYVADSVSPEILNANSLSNSPTTLFKTHELNENVDLVDAKARSSTDVPKNSSEDVKEKKIALFDEHYSYTINDESGFIDTIPPNPLDNNVNDNSWKPKSNAFYDYLSSYEYKPEVTNNEANEPNLEGNKTLPEFKHLKSIGLSNISPKNNVQKVVSKDTPLEYAILPEHRVFQARSSHPEGYTFQKPVQVQGSKNLKGDKKDTGDEKKSGDQEVNLSQQNSCEYQNKSTEVIHHSDLLSELNDGSNISTSKKTVKKIINPPCFHTFAKEVAQVIKRTGPPLTENTPTERDVFIPHTTKNKEQNTSKPATELTVPKSDICNTTALATRLDNKYNIMSLPKNLTSYFHKLVSWKYSSDSKLNHNEKINVEPNKSKEKSDISTCQECKMIRKTASPFLDVIHRKVDESVNILMKSPIKSISKAALSIKANNPPPGLAQPRSKIFSQCSVKSDSKSASEVKDFAKGFKISRNNKSTTSFRKGYIAPNTNEIESDNSSSKKFNDVARSPNSNIVNSSFYSTWSESMMSEYQKRDFIKKNKCYSTTPLDNFKKSKEKQYFKQPIENKRNKYSVIKTPIENSQLDNKIVQIEKKHKIKLYPRPLLTIPKSSADNELYRRKNPYKSFSDTRS